MGGAYWREGLKAASSKLEPSYCGKSYPSTGIRGWWPDLEGGRYSWAGALKSVGKLIRFAAGLSLGSWLTWGLWGKDLVFWSKPWSRLANEYIGGIINCWAAVLESLPSSFLLFEARASSRNKFCCPGTKYAVLGGTWKLGPNGSLGEFGKQLLMHPSKQQSPWPGQSTSGVPTDQHWCLTYSHLTFLCGGGQTPLKTGLGGGGAAAAGAL